MEVTAAKTAGGDVGGVQMQSMTLPQPWRKLLLAVHVAASVSVLGTDLALLALGIASVGGADPVTIYPAARLVGGKPLSAGERLPLLIAPAAASALLAIALALAIFKPGWRLRSSGTAAADASPRTQLG